MFYLIFIILAISFLANDAAVLRISDKYSGELEYTTADIISTTQEPDLTRITNQDLIITTDKGGLSANEKATILLSDQILLDSEPSKLLKTETQAIDLGKFGKLLLLSTPKIAEKPKEPEENLEESDEENEKVENGTQLSIETTTVADTANEENYTFLNAGGDITRKVGLDIEGPMYSESENGIKSKKKQPITNLSTTEKITKLYPINDTLYADNNKIIKQQTQDSAATAIEDQSNEALGANIVSVVLAEVEADYVLVESEALHGSYTDVESELHLQPIVQSVEIVPSSLDDTLLLNYTPSW